MGILGLGGIIGVIIGGVIVAALVILVFMSYRKSPPDEVMVVTGLGKEKFVIGNSSLVIPFLQRVDKLNLGVVQTSLKTPSPIPTCDAILIDVRAVANFQISTDPELLKVASRNYLNQDKAKMEQDVSEVLMGKMREVIGQMEIINLMQNRDEFNQKVFSNAQDDMRALGLELVTFNVQDFTDHEDVIKNMGADQANEIRKSAQFARIQADQEVAIRQNELDLKEAELKKTADRARAEAEMVYQTTTAEKTRELNIAQQEAEIAAEEKRIELKEKAVAVTERELEAEVKKRAEAERYAAEQKAEAALYVQQKDSEAELYINQKKAEAELYAAERNAEAVKRTGEADRYAAEQNAEAQLFSEQKAAEGRLYYAEQEAQAIKMTAEAESNKIEAIGKAEGEAERARGIGLAEATKEQIEAYNAMENSNFLADHYINIMPEMARAVAEPLSAVDSITMYGTGNAASLVEETTKMTSQVNAGLADSIGIDLKTVLGALVGGSAAGNAMAGAVKLPGELVDAASGTEAEAGGTDAENAGRDA